MSKPEEYDIVRLLRPLPQHNLPAGSVGTVVIDHAKYSAEKLPAAYLVEFSNSEGITQAMVTIYQNDLEVLDRPNK